MSHDGLISIICLNMSSASCVRSRWRKGGLPHVRLRSHDKFVVENGPYRRLELEETRGGVNMHGVIGFECSIGIATLL